MDESNFKFFSIGILAENKDLGSKMIKVTPIEQLPMLDGEIKANPTALVTSGQNSEGTAYQSKTISDNWIPATWRGETNRRTAPNVRRGERVEIYQAANSGKYYWKSCGDDDHLRKLETVVYTYSGTPNEGEDSTANGNCYFMEISTHEKLVTFQTSQKNGEPYLYTIQINAAEGIVTVTDDVGNFWEINTPETRITFKNADGTYVTLDKQDINGYAPQNITMTAGAKISHIVGATSLVMTPGTTVLTSPSVDINP